MPRRSPLISVTGALFMAMSVPVPMAMPTSARASTGASLMTSLAIAWRHGYGTPLRGWRHRTKTTRVACCGRSNATLADATPRRATAFPHRTTMERLISGPSSLIQHNRCRRPSALTDHRKSAMRHVASHAKATHMYRHLLVSVDGGGLSERAMTASIELAKKLGASITGFVAKPFAPPASMADAHRCRGVVDAHGAQVQAHAQKIISRFEKLSREAGVPFAGCGRKAAPWRTRSSRQPRNNTT